jgi:rubrerythrin
MQAANAQIHHDHLIRLVRLARQMEREGHYNAAKLLWAAAFSEEVRAANATPLATDREAVDAEFDTVISGVSRMGASPEVTTALVVARKAVREGHSIRIEQIPQVHVCRSCGAITLGEAPDRCKACGAFELALREFPPVHYLDPLPPAQALHALACAPDLLRSLIDGEDEIALDRSPAAGEWSILETLNHMRASEELVSYRINRMLDEDNPPLAAVSVPKSEHSGSAAEVFDAFQTSRRALVGRLSDIAPGDWWRTGWHEEFGAVTVLQQASYFAKHDHAHLTQIEAIRRALGLS